MYTYVFNLSWYLNNKEKFNVCDLLENFSFNKKAIDVNGKVFITVFLKPNNEIWGLLFCSLHFCVYLEIFDKKKLLKPIKTNEKECEKYMEILIFSSPPLGFLGANLP